MPVCVKPTFQMSIDFSDIFWRVSPQTGHCVADDDRGRTMNDAKADAKAIFLEALDCNGADELIRFLDRACGSDTALRTRVEELLRAHRDAGAFLGGGEKQDATGDQPLAEGPG